MTTPSTDTPTETELKFALRPGALEALRAGVMRQARATDLHAVYFDTPGASLFRNGCGLRVRRNGDRLLQTLKAGGDGLFMRGEWEWEVPSPSPRPDLLAETPAAGLVANQTLTRVFETDIRRETLRTTHAGAQIELALDVGEIRAGDLAEPVCELELELLSGPAEALFAFARTLAVPLVLTFETKTERGYRLRALAPADAPRRAGLRRLSEAILAGDLSRATLAAEELGAGPAGRDPANWAALLLDLAEQAQSASET